MPPKIWRPKAKNNYKPIIFDDVDDDLYVLKRYGKAMKRTPALKPRPRDEPYPLERKYFSCRT